MLKLKRTAMITALLCLFTFYVNAQSQAVQSQGTQPQKAESKTEITVKAVQEHSKKAPPAKVIAKATSSKPAKKPLEPWEAWDKFRPQMLEISRQLGVTCIHCHDSRNYRDSSKPTHKIAKAHMEMVDMINEKYKDSFSAKVDCYMCHKGVSKPEFKERKEKF